MTEFDPSKPVMRRDGSEAFILKTDWKGDATILGYVNCHVTGKDVIQAWMANGRVHPFFESAGDLVNIPESKWMNLYDNPADARIASNWHESRDEADRIAHGMDKDHPGGRRIAIVERKASGEFITTAVEK